MRLSEEPFFRTPAPERLKLQNRFYRCVGNHYRGGQQVQPHYHAESELILARAISGFAFAGGRKYRLEDGRLIFFPARQVHAFQFRPLRPDSTILCLQFDPLRFLPLLIDMNEEGAQRFEEVFSRAGVLSAPAGEAVARDFEALARLSERRESALKRGVSDMQAILTLLQALIGKPAPPPSAAPSGQDRLRLILDKIESGLNRKMNLDELSGACGLSKFHLCRYFRKATGLTLQTYINRQKVVRAERLMVEEGMNVSGAAYACGLESVSYFVRLFKRHAGVTPKAWVKNISGPR